MNDRHEAVEALERIRIAVDSLDAAYQRMADIAGSAKSWAPNGAKDELQQRMRDCDAAWYDAASERRAASVEARRQLGRLLGEEWATGD